MSKFKSPKPTVYPYKLFCYKSDSDKCPNCNRVPRDYEVPQTHPAIIPLVVFVCVCGHRYKEVEKGQSDDQGES